jgi:hypothetical protein
MNKTITINPNLLNVSKSRARRTKKNAPTSEDNNPIKIKSSTAPKNNRSIKRSILKFIRNHQENNYKKLMGGNKPGETSEEHDTSYMNDEGSDFDESVKYLMELTKESEARKKKEIIDHGRTLKNYDSTRDIIHNADIIDNMNYTTGGIVRNDNSFISPPMPTYGCLKNGNLPTYRQYSKTLKQFPSKISSSPQYNHPRPTKNTSSEIHNADSISNPRPMSNIVPDATSVGFNNGGSGVLKRTSEILQYKKKLLPSKKKIGFPKVKTTRRRTFNIGKSKTLQRVSILISNKTLRNKISTDAQLLKQTPITDVKRFLVKQGFIKIGSTTGHDVLREMYESVKMICGEIKNHNPETLLYNFNNDIEP